MPVKAATDLFAIDYSQESPMNLEHIMYEQNEAVVTITLNRPETLNALTPAMREGLFEAMTCADKDSNCLLYTSPSPRDGLLSRMPSSA